jgi:hypothetical protein
MNDDFNTRTAMVEVQTVARELRALLDSNADSGLVAAGAGWLNEMVSLNTQQPETIILPEKDLVADPSGWWSIRQAIVRYLGYGDNEYQGASERRRILSRVYKATFPTDHLKDSQHLRASSLIEHIETYGEPESKTRFKRICFYLSRRGMALIEKNVDKRVDGNHRSYRQVVQTFQDGIWFVENYGRQYNYVAYGKLGNVCCLAPLEPLLVFCYEDSLSESTAYSTEERYSSHAHLIANHPAFVLSDFITRSDEESSQEWVKQRGTMDPVIEADINRIYLSDHIAPMRADIDEYAGVPGDAVKRYRLDIVPQSNRKFQQKSTWPDKILRALFEFLPVIDRSSWLIANEEEQILILKSQNAPTMRNFRDQKEESLRRLLGIRNDFEFANIIKHVRKQIKRDDSPFVVAGRGKGVRYAKYEGSYEFHNAEAMNDE